MSDFIDIDESNKVEYNNVANHPLQSYEWGEFRKKTGVRVIRRGFIKNGKIVDGFTITLHKIPRTKLYIGYLPKGNLPTPEIIDEIRRIGKENNCVFIQFEPNLQSKHRAEIINQKSMREAAHPLFTKYTFIIDLTKSEQELLVAMHQKTRYNIKVAEKHKVIVKENNSRESFEHYLKLMHETTNRQAFYAHTPSYHRALFEALPKKNNSSTLSYHLLNAIYKPEGEKEQALVSWVMFVFKDTLYYPYGASSRLHREAMANNLMAWEAIKFGKKMGLKYFDMWGAMGPNPDKRDPWYGFHRFKEGYGGELVEFVGSYDLVIKGSLYEIYKIADKIRWGFLRLKKMAGIN
jgi:lipid II:glycine glycyltransferase (peptidoglycan interpeptide bridge formation enzyme)